MLRRKTISPEQLSYPVSIKGELSDPPARGWWLLKWLLGIPHYIILIFLWIAFMVVAIIAFFAIRGADIVLGKILGITALGFYQMAFRISYIVKAEIGVAFSLVTFPVFINIIFNLNKEPCSTLQGSHINTHHQL